MELLYCARCHRLILPREIEAGSNHWVDGESVCQGCFTRLSRRLRPVASVRIESREEPVPINLDELQREMSKGTNGSGVRALPDLPTRAARGSTTKTSAPGKALAPVASLIIGLLLGGAAYALFPPSSSENPAVKTGKNQSGKQNTKGTRKLPDKLGQAGDKAQPETTPQRRLSSPNQVTDPAPQKEATPKPATLSKDGKYRIRSIEDTFASAGDPGKTKHRQASLYLGSDGSKSIHEGYLKFDLTGVATPVKEVLLKLNKLRSTGVPGARQYVYLLENNDWTESKLTWKNRPQGGKQIGSWQITFSGNEAELEITKPVQEALKKGAKQLSFRLAMEELSEPTTFSYATRDATGNIGARLIISMPEKQKSETENKTPGENPSPPTSQKKPIETKKTEPGRPAIPTLKGLQPGLRISFFKLRGEVPKKLPRFNLLKATETATITVVNFPDSAQAWKCSTGKTPPDNFGCTIKGFLKISNPGVYRFILKSDDGSKLWLNHRLLIDNGGLHQARTIGEKTTLKAGLHPLLIEFYNPKGNSCLTLKMLEFDPLKSKKPKDAQASKGRPVQPVYYHKPADKSLRKTYRTEIIMVAQVGCWPKIDFQTYRH
jgi:PA14 domain-containing protein